jgi:hypothetical protein
MSDFIVKGETSRHHTNLITYLFKKCFTCDTHHDTSSRERVFIDSTKNFR